MNFLSVASPANLSVSLGKNSALQIQEVLCFLNLPESSKTASQVISALRMSKTCWGTTMETLSEPSSERLMAWGMTCNGKLLTAQPMYPKTERGFMLSEILEDSPAPKSFLSQKTQDRILSYQPLQQDIEGKKQTVAISVTKRTRKKSPSED